VVKCAEAVDLKAHLKVDLKAMSNGPIEIINGRERRRRWSLDEKLRIVAETHEPGASVRAVAARHDVYPNLLRSWRRQVGQGRLSAAPSARFVPVRVLEPAPMTAATASPAIADRAASDLIEIMLPDGPRVRVGSDVTLAALRRVMTVLRG
jgi:transposase